MVLEKLQLLLIYCLIFWIAENMLMPMRLHVGYLLFSLKKLLLNLDGLCYIELLNCWNKEKISHLKQLFLPAVLQVPSKEQERKATL